jgi:hypothetical protein
VVDQNDPTPDASFTAVRVSLQRPGLSGDSARDRHIATGGVSIRDPFRIGILIRSGSPVERGDYLLLQDPASGATRRVAPTVIRALRLGTSDTAPAWWYVLCQMPEGADPLVAPPAPRTASTDTAGCPADRFVPDQDTTWLDGLPAGDAPEPPGADPGYEQYDDCQTLDWSICEWLKIC